LPAEAQRRTGRSFTDNELSKYWRDRRGRPSNRTGPIPRAGQPEAALGVAQ
jgi:hypothetical protein